MCKECRSDRGHRGHQDPVKAAGGTGIVVVAPSITARAFATVLIKYNFIIN